LAEKFSPTFLMNSTPEIKELNINRQLTAMEKIAGSFNEQSMQNQYHQKKSLS